VIVFQAPRDGNLYKVGFHIDNSSQANTITSVDDLHRACGHINEKDLKNAVNKGIVEGVELENGECETCILSKFRKQPFPNSTSQQKLTRIGELISSDVCQVWNNFLGFKYFITFTDHYSRFVTVYPLKLNFRIMLPKCNVSAFFRFLIHDDVFRSDEITCSWLGM
jgi:hypothetical protein